MLKLLRRATQLFFLTALVTFITYVQFTSGGKQWGGALQYVAMLRPLPSRVVCSSNLLNMFDEHAAWDGEWFSTREDCVLPPCETFKQ